MKEDLKNRGWEQMSEILDREMPVDRSGKRGTPFFLKVAAAIFLPLLLAAGVYLGWPETGDREPSLGAFYPDGESLLVAASTDGEKTDVKPDSGQSEPEKEIDRKAEQQPTENTFTQAGSRVFQESAAEETESIHDSEQTNAREDETIFRSETELPGNKDFLQQSELALDPAEKQPLAIEKTDRAVTPLTEIPLAFENEAVAEENFELESKAPEKELTPATIITSLESENDCPYKWAAGMNYSKPFYTYTHGTDLLLSRYIDAGKNQFVFTAGISAHYSFREFDRDAFSNSFDLQDGSTTANTDYREQLYKASLDQAKNLLRSFGEFTLAAGYEYELSDRWAVGIQLAGHRLLWSDMNNPFSHDGMGTILFEGTNISEPEARETFEDNVLDWRLSAGLTANYRFNCNFSGQIGFSQNLSPFYHSDKSNISLSSSQLHVGVRYHFGQNQL